MDMESSLHGDLKKFYGALAELAKRTGCSRQHVIDVVKGHRNSSFIKREAEILLEEKTNEITIQAEKL